MPQIDSTLLAPIVTFEVNGKEMVIFNLADSNPANSKKV